MMLAISLMVTAISVTQFSDLLTERMCGILMTCRMKLIVIAVSVT